MFIRFDGSGPDTVERTIECRDYEVRLSKSCRQRLIRILDKDNEAEFVLQEGEGNWNRAYLMNDDGHTIETILAPSLAAFQDAGAQAAAEAAGDAT